MKPLAESILASHYTTHRNNGACMLYASAIRCSRLFKDVRLRILNTSVPLAHLAFSIEKTYECPACISNKRRLRQGILHFSTPLT